MAESIKGFVVTLEASMHGDDADQLADAIRCLRGVVEVQPSVDTYEDVMNRSQVFWRMRDALLKALEARGK